MHRTFEWNKKKLLVCHGTKRESFVYVDDLFLPVRLYGCCINVCMCVCVVVLPMLRSSWCFVHNMNALSHSHRLFESHWPNKQGSQFSQHGQEYSQNGKRKNTAVYPFALRDSHFYFGWLSWYTRHWHKQHTVCLLEYIDKINAIQWIGYRYIFGR